MSKGRLIAGSAVLSIAAAVTAFTKPWEGEKQQSYQDIIGVWTACMGVTEGVVPSKTYTRAECDAMNADAVRKHLLGVAKCIKRPLAEHEWVAVGSWTYNVGVSAACGSTLVQQINQGAPGYVWCKQLLRWDRAGGKKVRGLTRRREAEYAVCIGAD